MKKFLSLTLLAMIFSVASFAQLPPIGGPTSLCLGSTATVYDTSSTGGSGTWSSSNTTVCTIGLTTGTIYGVSPGTSTITYYSGGSSTSMTFTVNPAPPPAITGTASFCVGTTSQLSDAASGGTWSSGSAFVASVTSTGLVYGANSGTAVIYYSTGGVCSASINVTVNATQAGSIITPATICAAGGTATLTDSATTGGVSTGTWSSSNTSVATIGVTSGIITGIAVGTTTITFTVPGTCGTAYATQTINVINTTSAGTISGIATVYTGGATATLNETVSGGTWSSNNTTVATIDPSTGVYAGVSVGTAVITYSVSGCGGTATTTYTVTVAAINGISGNVYFPGTAYYGPVKIWLITYNSSTLDLEAIDSMSTFSSGTSVYYQFLNPATDSYRVKAAASDTTGITTGYIPTYHISSFYWYAANVINHTYGTADINEDINMAYGTVTSGPGFIGGSVTAGANRGTSTTGIPVVGMNVNVLNSTTNLLMQSTTTDINGNYSFSSLPLGTYYVFPDSLNYLTTAYTSITLASGAATMSAADFTQHTISKTITPNTEGVSNVSNTLSSVSAFPNPTNGKLNLQWNEQAAEKGNVTITDITGREIYKTAINMNQGTGVKQLDLSGFANGLYMISVKSATINYNTKIQIQH